jgi:tetratricopeptide (TPR) repeat protein
MRRRRRWSGALRAAIVFVSLSPAAALSAPQAAPADDLEGLRTLLQDGRYAEAESRSREFLNRVEASAGRNGAQAADPLDLLVEALWRGGKGLEPETRRLAERALETRERTLAPDHPDLARSLHNLGTVLKILGEYGGSKSLHERALAIRERALGPDHLEVAASLNLLGNLLNESGDYSRARSIHQRALAIREKAFGPWHFLVAQSLTNLANDLQAVDEYAESRPHHERALAIYEKVLRPDHPIVPMALHNLANVLAELKEHPAARLCFERALAIVEKARGPDDPMVATILNALAGLHVVTGDLPKARSLRERTLAIREKAFGPDHPLLADTLNRLAKLQWAAGEIEESVEGALRAERIARDQFQHAARGLAETEALRYEKIRTSGLDVTFSVLASTPAASLPPWAVERVWDGLIRSRAMVLDEMAQRHHAALSKTSAEADSLRQALVAARGRLASLLVRGLEPSHSEDYRARVAQARSDEERAERDLARKSASFRAELAEVKIGLREVAAALPAGSALAAFVEYGRVLWPVESPGDAPIRPIAVPHYAALVLRSGQRSPAFVPLGPAEPIEALIRAWREEAASPPPGLPVGGSLAEERYHDAARRLREATWDPLVPSLREPRMVFVVADGSLNLVNFAALPTSEARYLLEAGPILHYVSAERDLAARSGAKPPLGKGLLALGGPDFEAPPVLSEPRGGVSLVEATSPAGSGTATRPAAYRSPPATCGDFRSLRFDPLPGSGAEVLEVESLWHTKPAGGSGRPESARKLIGPAASEAAFKRMAPGHRILHLASHGFFLHGHCASTLGTLRESSARPPERGGAGASDSGDNPLLLSGLALAGANRRAEAGPGDEDGILTAEEIASLDLSGVEWAVLSACETGVGPILAGEGVLGLRRAFEVAGAETLIMSLWRVPDEASREWMRNLYEARLAGLSTAEAVRQAGRAIVQDRRSHGKSAHPFFWGAFVAAGDWK